MVRPGPTPSTWSRYADVAMALHRSRDQRILGGVCGGIARSLGWGPTRVRVLYVLVSILSAAFPGALVYLILWIAVPLEPRR
jgi:phage shock protein C